MKGAVVLLVALALLLPGALAADTPVQSSAYRVDLGPLAPGDAREGNFTLSNPENLLVDVHLVASSTQTWVRLPATITLGPGAAVEVPYTYIVPADATPGEHGEAVLLVVGERPEGSATLAAASAIVFTSRTSALGVSAIDAPPLVLPGDAVGGTIQLVNTWARAVNATADVEWRDSTGALRGSAHLGPALVPVNGSARLHYSFPPADATAGAQTMMARVISADVDDAPLAGAALQTFLFGRRSAMYSLAGVDDMGDGNATVRIILENTGDVPVTLQPRVVVGDSAGIERSVLLDPVTLAPGERREVAAYLALPPGTFQLALQVEGAEVSVSPLSLDANAPLELHMSAPRDPDAPLRLVAMGFAGAALLLVAFLVWRKRLALRSALSRAATRARSALARPSPAPADPFDALFERLEASEARPQPMRATPTPPPPPGRSRPAALLLDLDGLGTTPLEVARLTLFAAGRDVVAAYAYTRAPTADAAIRVHHELASAGFTPRVVVDGDDLRVLVTIDAMRESHAGRDVLLATRDAAYGPLAQAIQENGGRLEGFLVPRRVPVNSDEKKLKSAQREPRL